MADAKRITMETWTDGYNHAVSTGDNPDVLCCNSNMLGFALKEVYHGKIPITFLSVNDALPNGAVQFGNAPEEYPISRVKPGWQDDGSLVFMVWLPKCNEVK